MIKGIIKLVFFPIKLLFKSLFWIAIIGINFMG